MNAPKVRILHETNPEKYFPALYALDESGHIKLTGAHRTSVCREWLRAGFKDRAPFAARTRNAMQDARFRLGQQRISGELIVLGFAPWDARLLWYEGLARRNKVIYHTSWPDWRLTATPRQPLFTQVMRRRWQRFLAHPNVTSVAVLDPVASALAHEMQTKAHVIPHAVPEPFFRAPQSTPSGPLRLLFVGELSAKKGLPQVLNLFSQIPGASAELTVIGQGPLQDRLPEHVRYLGAISDRKTLADEMAQHDILLSLSQRTSTWEELFGLVIAEAVAARCGVIASDHIGPRTILQDAPGLVAENDPQSVLDLLQRFIGDRSALAQFQTAQSPKAVRFALSKVAARWRALFDELTHA